MVTEREKELIIGVIKMFIKSKWCMTPEAIALYITQYGEKVAVDTVIAVQSEYRG